MGRNGLRLYRVSAEREPRKSGSCARQQFSREAGRENGEEVPESRQLLLERRDVLLEGFDRARSGPAASAQNGDAPGRVALVYEQNVYVKARPGVPALREHLGRLRPDREGAGGDRHRPGRYRLE